MDRLCFKDAYDEELVVYECLSISEEIFYRNKVRSLYNDEVGTFGLVVANKRNHYIKIGSIVKW